MNAAVNQRLSAPGGSDTSQIRNKTKPTSVSVEQFKASLQDADLLMCLDVWFLNESEVSSFSYPVSASLKLIKHIAWRIFILI